VLLALAWDLPLLCRIAGGEGTSRPLSAPSSDRTRAMQHHQQQGQRPSSPFGRGGRQAGVCNEHPAVPAAVAVEH
jgi:hypothetical protein